MGHKEPAFQVLMCENICVHKDTFSFVVTEEIGNRRRKPTYHPKLPDAIQEVSRRLFYRKLEARAQAEKYDFESLIQLVKEHIEDINAKFSI